MMKRAFVFILAAAVLLGGCRGRKAPPQSTLPLDGLEQAEVVFEAQGPVFVVNGATYAAATSAKALFSPEYGGGKAAPGAVVGYTINDDRYVYFAEAEGMPAGWLLAAADDGSGSITADNAETLLKTEDAEIPDWVTAYLRDKAARIAALTPASGSDLA